jgi:hypothetical protein
VQKCNIAVLVLTLQLSHGARRAAWHSMWPPRAAIVSACHPGGKVSLWKACFINDFNAGDLEAGGYYFHDDGVSLAQDTVNTTATLKALLPRGSEPLERVVRLTNAIEHASQAQGARTPDHLQGVLMLCAVCP